MSSVPQLSGVRSGLSPLKLRVVGGVVLALVGAAGLGAMVGRTPQLALLFAALAFVVLATPLVDQLSVACFWFLPYLILNLPLGGMTLKVPEVTAYLFAAAAITRSLLRRESIALPSPTPQVLLYLGVCAISAMLSPAVPGVFAGYFSGLQGVDLRSFSILFWLALSWAVVVAMYNVIGTSPDLYRRCVRAHVLAGAISSLIGIVGYILALRGNLDVLQRVGHSHSFVYTGGSFYRLTGVSYEPVVMAFYLVTVIPTTLAVVLRHRDWMPKWLSVSALTLQGIALFLTFSAGGWAALAAGLLPLAWLFRGQRINWPAILKGSAAVAVPLCLGFLFASGNPVISRVMGLTTDKFRSGGYKMRDDEILTGMRIFQDHFWLGVGPGMSPFYFPTYHPVVHSMGELPPFISNLYVTTLAENGVLGLTALALCGIVGLSSLAGTIKCRGALRVPVLAALTASLIGCAVQYWEAINLFLIYFPVLIGLAVAGARLAQTDSEEFMSGSPRVSVIVATYNAAATLERCLASYERQTDDSRELIVMDGGSTDGTVDLIRRHSSQIGYWESQPDRGIYHAWNKALEHARGSGSVSWEPMTVSGLTMFWNGWRRCWRRLVRPSGSSTVRSPRSVRAVGYCAAMVAPGLKSERAFVRTMNIPHPGLMHHRSLFDEHGVFDESLRIAADYDFLLRELQAGDALFVPDLIVVAMQHGGLSYSPAAMPQMLQEQARIRAKHGLPPLSDWRSMSRVLFKMKLCALVTRCLGEKTFRRLADRYRHMTGREPVWR